MMRETDEEHGISINEIIDRLAEYGIRAERKSIYDDFLVLEELGFPISHYGSRPPRYSLEERIFETAELKMLVDAVQSSKFITAKKSREIIEKLQLFAGVYHARELSRQVYVENRLKTVNNSTIYTIDAIHTSINDSKQLSFKYFDYNGEKKKVLRHGGAPYLVSPFALLWDDEKYYLVAYDENAEMVKNFRVDKMQEACVLDASATRGEAYARFDPADYSRKIFGMYGGREELVTFECRDPYAGVMIDRFGTDVHFITTDFGFKFSHRAMISPTFFGWLAELGTGVRIVSPEGVRVEFLEHIRRIAENYG